MVVARALNLLDDRRPDRRRAAVELLDQLCHSVPADAGHVIGITGPPGVGKSSLTGALIAAWRNRGLSVAVLAVDPSSPVGGGALLGDRLRMLVPETDDGVFIRSIADRRRAGGLADEAWAMTQVLAAAFDIAVVETVGVGQRDTDITDLADTTCLVVQPFAGDAVQVMKAGILEVPSVVAVNKTDLGGDWSGTAAEIAAITAGAGTEEGWTVPVMPTSARDRAGITELADALADHRFWLAKSGHLVPNRRAARAAWILDALHREVGTRGVAQLGGETALRARLIADADRPDAPSAPGRLAALLAEIT